MVTPQCNLETLESLFKLDKNFPLKEYSPVFIFILRMKRTTKYILKVIEALPGVLGNRRIISGNRGTKAKFCGEQGDKDNIGEQGT